jgi:hypothetical protein
MNIKRVTALLTVIILALPMMVGAAEWHMVPDEVYSDVPLTNGPVIGAVLVDSIKKIGDHAEAQVSMFYNYDLVQAATEAISKPGRKYSDVRSKTKAAIASGRLNVYVGIESLFKERGAGFISSSDEDIRLLLVTSEILIDEGYAPMSTRIIQVRCKSQSEFEGSYDGGGHWGLIVFPRLPQGGHGSREQLYPFICDKVGLGQNAPAPPPPPTPELALLQRIADGLVLPKWKFLGVNTNQYGRKSFMFVAADTIQKKGKYADVVIASAEYGNSPNPDMFISGVQEGKYRPGALNYAHVHCDSESVDDYFPGAKVIETPLVSYVCSHQGH